MKLYTLSKTQDLENHTLFSGTYPSRPNKVMPHPLPPPRALHAPVHGIWHLSCIWLASQVLKYFCETCDEAICRDCAIYEHREHMYVDLREAVKKYRSTIAALQDKTKRKIPVLRAAVEEVHDVTRDLRERVEVVRNTIRNTIQNQIRELEKQERELIDQLESISDSKEEVKG